MKERRLLNSRLLISNERPKFPSKRIIHYCFHHANRVTKNYACRYIDSELKSGCKDELLRLESKYGVPTSDWVDCILHL